MDCTIKTLGPCTFPSPLLEKYPHLDTSFVSDSVRLRYRLFVGETNPQSDSDATFELAGQRRMIHFKPEETTAAVVTCGGLCPGLNDVIRSIVMESLTSTGSRRS
jgi:6-phosphofructokinase 1